MGEIANLYAKIGADTSGLKKGLTDSKSQLTGFGSQLNNTVKNLTGFSLTSIGVAAVVREVGKAVKETVDETQAYNLSMVDMARKMGTSTEEASKLTQVADDVRLSTEQLSTAMNFAIRNGIQPSIEGLSKLADEYLALDDPVERGQLLLKTFGRSGMEMGKLLEQGGEGIRSMAADIEDGLIVTEKAAAASKAYYQELDALNDEITALKMNIGNGLIPALTSVLQQWRFQGDAVEELGPVMTDADLWSRRLAAGQLAAAAAAGAASAGIVDMGEQMRNANHNAQQMTGSIENQVATAYIAGIEMDKLAKYYMDGGYSAEESAAMVQELVTKIGLVKSKEVTITTYLKTVDFSLSQSQNDIRRGRSAQGGALTLADYYNQGGRASGADFVVPPGFPGDSFPMRVQSGERVKVTPAGQTSTSGESDGWQQVAAAISSLPRMIRDAMQGASV